MKCIRKPSKQQLRLRLAVSCVMAAALSGCFSPGTATYIVSVAPDLKPIRGDTAFKLSTTDTDISFEIPSRVRLKSACASLMIAIPYDVRVQGMKARNFATVLLDVEPKRDGVSFDPTQVVLVYEGREYKPSSVMMDQGGRPATGPEILTTKRSYHLSYPFDLNARESFQFKVDQHVVSFVPHKITLHSETGEAGCIDR